MVQWLHLGLVWLQQIEYRITQEAQFWLLVSFIHVLAFSGIRTSSFYNNIWHSIFFFLVRFVHPQEILERSSLTGSKLRREVCEITEKVREQQADLCQCRKPNVDACNSCLRHGVVNLLCDKGFKATVCTSKWSESKKIPGGNNQLTKTLDWV